MRSRVVHSAPGGAKASLLLCALLCAAALPPARPVDLDVGVPPGSPLEWGLAFPAITPGDGPLFPGAPRSGAGGGPEEPAARTTSRTSRPELDVRIASSFALVRILTWDLAAHLAWIADPFAPQPPPRPAPPVDGGLEAPLPRPGEPLYFVALAPLLRLLLHPGALSESELLVHLIELGEPTLAVLDAASSEGALKSACATLAQRIAAPRREPRARPALESPRRSMLVRFVREELLRAHPFDPGGDFGRRLFLFGDELEPIVRELSVGDDALTARNATAALGRYRTRSAAEALLHGAATSTDPVVMARALAGLARFRGRIDAGPLLARLAKSDDELERVALIGALGRLGVDAAVPELVALGRRARERPDADLLQAVLTALARVPRTSASKDVAELAGDVRRWVEQNPRVLRPRGSGKVVPDVPDAPELKAATVAQLALCVLVRADPGDAARRSELAQLIKERAPGDAGAPSALAPFFLSLSLSDVAPAARHAVLEVLPLAGEPGFAALRRVALDTSAEPALRALALTQLAFAEREELAPALFFDLRESAELRVQAFELLVADRHPRVVEAARALLVQTAALEPGAGSALERYLGVSAVRALAARGVLASADLLPLLVHPRAARYAFGSLPAELRAQVEELVREAAQNAPRNALLRRIDTLLELALERELNPRLTRGTRESVRSELASLLEGASAHQRDAVHLRGMVESVLARLLGYLGPSAASPFGGFEPRVLLEEEILLALGHVGGKEAVDALVLLLANRERAHRAVACLALGVAGDAAAARVLVPYLLDSDGFTRLCAYEALRHLTGEDHFADWIYGTRAEHTRAAELYFRLVAKAAREAR